MILLGTTYQTVHSFLNISEQVNFKISIYNDVDAEFLTVDFENGETAQLNRNDIKNYCEEITDYLNAVYFYSPHEKYGEFSNFSAHGIEINNLYYATVEHYYQSQKFLDNEYQEKIRLCGTPKEASTLGQSRTVSFCEDWEEKKREVMKIALRKKFETHLIAQKQLLETGDKLLIENSPYDRYWGIGRGGDGKNYLGILLMQLRDQLRKEKVF